MEEQRLVQIDRARLALERATEVGEVKTNRDQAEAIRLFLKQQTAGLEVQNRAAETKLYAERRLGELFGKTVSKGDNPRLQRETLLPPVVSRIQSHRWQTAASMPERDFDRHLRESKARAEERTRASVLWLAKELRRESEHEALRSEPVRTASTKKLESLVGARKRFRTIYADPPWDYDKAATRASSDDHYPTMDAPSICALPVRELPADSAHRHLWTTDSFLFEVREVFEAWGFE